MRKPTWSVQKKALFSRHAKRRRDQVLDAIVGYPCYSSVDEIYMSEEKWNSIQRDIAASKFTLATHGITEEDIRDKNLDERDPGKSRFLWTAPARRHPRALEAMKNPLAFAAAMMRVNGRKVTKTALARELNVSERTLYRRYGRQEIKRVCREPVWGTAEERVALGAEAPASSGKKKPIRTRSGLD